MNFPISFSTGSELSSLLCCGSWLAQGFSIYGHFSASYLLDIGSPPINLLNGPQMPGHDFRWRIKGNLHG